MQSFKTMYRVVVMAATIVIVVQAWKLYGPSSDQVKSLALRAVEVAKRSLRPSSEPGATAEGPSPLSGDPSTDAPPFAAPIGQSSPAARTGPLSDQSPSESITPIPAPQQPDADADRLQTLFARLEQLGARDPQLIRWGASGQLFRFCCQATWGESTQFTRHFESVAAEPVLAVQQVVAEVDAWRMAQRDGTSFR